MKREIEIKINKTGNNNLERPLVVIITLKYINLSKQNN